MRSALRMRNRLGAGLRVLVIGGGIGGLTLAQGLRRAGVDVTVYERDVSALVRTQGYRLRISPEGEQGLRSCLPDPVLALVRETANRRYASGLMAVDEQLRPQWAPEFTDPRAETPDKIDAVDRVTLRQMLLAGLDRVVRFGKRLRRAEVTEDGVTAYFTDGEVASGDVLVAADGANSVLRQQFQSDQTPHDLGVRTVFSRIPRAAAHAGGLPNSLRDKFSYVIGSDGHHLGLMPMVFRDQPAAVAARLWPGLALPTVEDYYLAVFNVHRDELGMADAAFFDKDAEALKEFVIERTRGWHPHLRGVFALAEVADTFAVPLRATIPVRPWRTRRLIAIGDAAHAMPPSGGVGANSAIQDAALLSRLLSELASGHLGVQEVAERYERGMVKQANTAVQLSLRIAQWSIKKLDVSPAG